MRASWDGKTFSLPIAIRRSEHLEDKALSRALPVHNGAPNKHASSGAISRKPWKACSRWSWLRLMDSHLKTLRSKPILLPSALNNSTSTLPQIWFRPVLCNVIMIIMMMMIIIIIIIIKRNSTAAACESRQFVHGYPSWLQNFYSKCITRLWRKEKWRSRWYSTTSARVPFDGKYQYIYIYIIHYIISR